MGLCSSERANVRFLLACKMLNLAQRKTTSKPRRKGQCPSLVRLYSNDSAENSTGKRCTLCLQGCLIRTLITRPEDLP
ncbi:protein of unknown function [Candidatus Nitrospira inopinata]|uniref:Uncharacterized protein n=1 Tax=Candidatus Nitrospira inopinata TaxID=1715989 RepID=A0A0S4KQV7_9BACT|nr:protein of unknown function [Candidatus Nitrospira inopinata]